jgi:hypothetical protein
MKAIVYEQYEPPNVLRAGGPVLKNANFPKNEGAPGLDFETWEGNNASFASVNPLKSPFRLFFRYLRRGNHP